MTIGRIIINTLREEMQNSSGSHWTRNTKVTSAVVYVRIRQNGGTMEDAMAGKNQTKLIMETAATSVRGTEKRFRYSIMLALSAMDEVTA